MYCMENKTDIKLNEFEKYLLFHYGVLESQIEFYNSEMFYVKRTGKRIVLKNRNAYIAHCFSYFMSKYRGTEKVKKLELLFDSK